MTSAVGRTQAGMVVDWAVARHLRADAGGVGSTLLGTLAGDTGHLVGVSAICRRVSGIFAGFTLRQVSNQAERLVA